MTIISRPPLAAAVAVLALAPAAAADTYIVDFFPETPSPSNTLQLRFLGPSSGVVTNTRLVISFTTLGSFNAADLVVALVVPVTPDDPDGGFWFLTGQDLGWQGQGTFTADVSTHAINGSLNPGLWGFELGSLLDPPAYAGSFSADSRFELTIIPAPGAAALAAAGLAIAGARRRRVSGPSRARERRAAPSAPAANP